MDELRGRESPKASIMSDLRLTFQNRVTDLVNQTKAWAEANEWLTKTYPKKMRDTENQPYEAPALLLQKGPTKVLLDPVAYDVPGSEGVVDLYLMPTYDDLASLYFAHGAWTIHYAFPPNPLDTHSVVETAALLLSERSLNQVLDSIAAHAEPSF
jgi:hypothetical protein